MLHIAICDDDRKRMRCISSVAILILCTAFFLGCYPCPHIPAQVTVDLETGEGISRMLADEDATVYLSGEAHRTTESLQFRNQLFQYLVEHKGVRILIQEAGYCVSALDNEMVHGRYPESSVLRGYMPQEDYLLLQWIQEYNQTAPTGQDITVVGVDVTDQVEDILAYLQYMLVQKPLNKKEPATTAEKLLVEIAGLNYYVESAQKRFDTTLLPELVRMADANPDTFRSFWGEESDEFFQVMERCEQRQQYFEMQGGEMSENDLPTPQNTYRESCLYKNFCTAFSQNPNAKYYGQFGGAHVLQRNYNRQYVENSLAQQLSKPDSAIAGDIVTLDCSYIVKKDATSDAMYPVFIREGTMPLPKEGTAELYRTAAFASDPQNASRFYPNNAGDKDCDYTPYHIVYNTLDGASQAQLRSGNYWKSQTR